MRAGVEPQLEYGSGTCDRKQASPERATDSRLARDLLHGADMDLLRLLCAIFVPPLGVFLQVGIGKHFWINILLTLLGYLPGIIHAVWIILRED